MILVGLRFVPRLPNGKLTWEYLRQGADTVSEGDNLHYDMYISFSDAVLGTSKDIETVSGKSLRIDADSLCVHGDNDASVQSIKQLRELLAS